MTTKENLRYYGLATAVLLTAVVAWHIAAAVTLGTDLLDPVSGLDVLKATLGSGDPAPETPHATSSTAGVGAALFVLAIVTAVVVDVRRRRARAVSTPGQMAGGRALRREMAGSAEESALRPFAYLDGQALTLRNEDNGAVVAPPRIGKTMYLAIPLIVDAPGAVVSTSTKPDVLRLTAGIRERVGTVHVFDPEGVSLWPNRIQWDMVTGCEVPEEAAERAGALVGSRDLGDGRNASFFQEAADTVLRCLLHAAALKPGGNMRDVVRWARDFSLDEPYDLLRERGGGVKGWVDDLAKFCRGEARETVSSTDMSLGLVLKAFGLPAVLDSVCPRPGEGFDPTRFHTTRDTLYLLSRSGKTSLSAPIITALVTAVERRARLAAGHTATGRIDPPISLILDEVANVAPVRDLASLMSDGGGRGVLTWVFVQSRRQLAQRYGQDDAKTILDSASVFVMLAGCKDVDHLRELSALAGEHLVERVSSSTGTGGSAQGSVQHSWERQPLMAPEAIRTIGMGKAFMLYRAAAPAVATLVPWWERKDRRDFEASLASVLRREGLGATISADDLIAQATNEHENDLAEAAS
ncbi:type IV secretory system conjugative DNA transfer family protein [Cellulomonas sp. HD19AZ1]|uniref:type IV secretory system conjugative DNA transfer family protein n=1 Tax=Cellulomonas sp. HD19AZ1 TaxID=2559593 RepID=UPI0010714168|nr:TraM recognition domain-containing protein [Cellulomonas sp. HD19AZ1]TFH68158.1 hypothetical protein E4A51_18105 [Cellulomonas sp. HD19AZ1]